MRMMKRSAGSNSVVWLVSEKVTFPAPVEKSHFMCSYVHYVLQFGIYRVQSIHTHTVTTTREVPECMVHLLQGTPIGLRGLSLSHILGQILLLACSLGFGQ